MELDHDLPRPRDRRALSGAFVKAAQLLGRHGSTFEALEAADEHGASRDAISFLRAKSTMATTSGATWAAGLVGEAAVGGFVEALRGQSAYAQFTTLANVFPVRQRIVCWSGLPRGIERTNEGEAFPVIQGSLAGVTLQERDIGALIVLSREVLADDSPAAFELLRRELLRAGAAGIDAEFLATASAGLTPQPGDPSDPMPSLSAAYAAAVTSGGSRALWVLGVDAARALATAEGTSGRLYPELSPTGGLLLGAPAVVADEIPTSHALLLDGAGWNVAPLALDVKASTAGSVKFQGQAAAVSLWQNGLISLRINASFAMAPVRADAAALIAFQGPS